jgi:uncharacterized protein YdeI (YjbR/CyaY-like superfamily)
MPELKINSLDELSTWLKTNGQSAGTTWLIFPKKTIKTDFAWSEIVDVLLAWGWIDSVGRKIDDQYTSLRISPRNPKSNWSKINKDKVAILQQKDLIQPQGQKMIDLAKSTGTWSALDDVDNLILPNDLEQYLVTNSLLSNWNSKSTSFKRGFLETLLRAKKHETRINKFKKLEL